MFLRLEYPTILMKLENKLQISWGVDLSRQNLFAENLNLASRWASNVITLHASLILPLFENDNPIALHLMLDELLKNFISPKNYSRT